jgi:hypothetical protein
MQTESQHLLVCTSSKFGLLISKVLPTTENAEVEVGSKYAIKARYTRLMSCMKVGGYGECSMCAARITLLGARLPALAAWVRPDGQCLEHQSKNHSTETTGRTAVEKHEARNLPL